MRAVGRIVLVLSLVAVAGCGGSGKETPSVTSGRLAATTTITIPPTTTTTTTYKHKYHHYYSNGYY